MNHPECGPHVPRHPLFFFAIVLCGIPVLVSAQGSYPVDKLPPYIHKVVDIGERSEISLDGKKVMYVTKAGGEVEEFDLKAKTTRVISSFPHPGVGFYRCYYLSNGDYFLGGGPQRADLTMYILDKSLTKPPVLLEKFYEGPAISRTQLKIAWTPDYANIYMAEIAYTNGVPRLINKKKLFGAADPPHPGGSQCVIETQNWRRPVEEEFTFSCYNFRGGEVYGCNTRTGAYANYSNYDYYDEPEGIFPNGEWTLEENDSHRDVTGGPRGAGYIDIYMLKLDKSYQRTRLTNFNDTKGYRSSNPVMSDDARFFIFQEAWTDEAAGVGHALFLFDLEAAGIRKKLSYIGCMDPKASNYDSTAFIESGDCHPSSISSHRPLDDLFSIGYRDKKIEVKSKTGGFFSIRVFDTQGKKVAESDRNIGSAQIPLGSSPRGVHLMEIQSDNRILRKILLNAMD
jgi:hypothetical protein